jgi:hypothetical protein
MYAVAYPRKGCRNTTSNSGIEDADGRWRVVERDEDDRAEPLQRKMPADGRD